MAMEQVVRRFWLERAPRERQALATGVGILAFIGLLLVFVEPALSGIARLQKTLPVARQQAARLDALVGEARALKALPAAATAADADVRTLLVRSLEDAGLGGARRDAPPGGAGVRLTFANVPYAKWSTWLAGAERTLGVRASAVHVRSGAGNTAGSVDVELVLTLPRS